MTEDARHVPVMLNEVLEALAPRPGETMIDGTFGAGGYTRALLEVGVAVVAIDRDPDAIAAGRLLEQASAGRLTLVRGPFSHLDTAIAEPVDGVVLDVGVSSMQLDEAGRGFSFRNDGPLDMRMAQSGVTAADIVNRFKPADLIRIFGLLGEERHSGRIARIIERRRAERPFQRTLDLAETIEAAIGRKPGDKIHPATRVFQALRIFVNDELGQLAQALFAAERALKPGGRLAVVSFHSLEDRIVKRFLAARAGGSAGSRHRPETRPAPSYFDQPAAAAGASEAEAERNPRARSARLRSAVRSAEPAGPADLSIFGFPQLPALPRGEDR